MPKRPKNDLAVLARAARAQIRRAEALGETLDARVEAGKLGGGPWVPDEDWRKDFNSVTATVVQAGQSLIRAMEGNKKNLSSVPTEQLEAQFKAEMMRAAANMTPEEWAMLDKVRMKQVLK